MSTEPDVDIVVPEYGNLGLTRRCLTSMLATVVGARVIMVDDASRKRGVRDYLRKLAAGGQVTAIRQPANAGHFEACHAGVSAGRDRFILSINSDVEARSPGWLQVLLPADDAVAVTGALLTFPPSSGPLAGTIQHAGVARGRRGLPIHPLYHLPSDHPQALRAHGWNAVPGACLLVRRGVWQSLAGFDRAFGRGMYADVDFCWRVRQTGNRTWYRLAASSWRFEHGSDLAGKTLLSESGEANLKPRFAKWGRLPGDEYLFGVPVTLPTVELKRQGSILHRSGDLPGAESAFRQALAQAPEGGELIAGIGRVDMDAGRLALAARYLTAARRLRPVDPRTPPSLAQLGARRAGGQQRQWHVPARKVPGDPFRKPPPPGGLPRVLFLPDSGVSQSYRMEFPALGLASLGWRTRVCGSFSADTADEYDLFVFSRVLTPHALVVMQFLYGLGKPMVLDVDDCFHALPADHPGYDTVGPGNPGALAALEKAVAMADALTVTTAGLGEFYSRWARRVAVAPNCWSRGDPCSSAPGPAHDPVALGWVGDATERRDVLQMRAGVLAAMEACSRSQLVVAGDEVVYDLFASLPASRRRYLPAVPLGQDPKMLAQFDVLLAPLATTEFNRFKSDLKLLEAGVRGIPWVASETPSYLGWADGGLLVGAPGQWQTAVLRVLDDDALRRQLGAAGHAKAHSREISAGVHLWADLYEDVLQKKAGTTLPGRAAKRGGP